MAGIAIAESGGTPRVVQQGQPYATTGWGLWQITPGNSEPQAGIDTQLLTAHRNGLAAVAKYNAQGLTAWYGDRTWSAWKRNGAPTYPTASQVAGYVASWGGSFGSVQAPPSTGSTTAPGNVVTAWEHLRAYAAHSFPVQMGQWDALARYAERL